MAPQSQSWLNSSVSPLSLVPASACVAQSGTLFVRPVPKRNATVLLEELFGVVPHRRSLQAGQLVVVIGANLMDALGASHKDHVVDLNNAAIGHVGIRGAIGHQT